MMIPPFKNDDFGATRCCAACKDDTCDGWGIADGLDADGKGDCNVNMKSIRFSMKSILFGPFWTELGRFCSW